MDLKAYAKIQGQIKELEEARDQMKIVILAQLAKEGIMKEVTKFGTFTRAHRVSYKYSNKVTELAEKVKLAKIREEEKGLAKASITEYLVYTAI